jgi:hypothetical protein
MSFNLDFTNDVAASNTVPKGSYKVVCESFEEKQSQSGNDRLILSFRIIEGEQKGRVLYEGYNMTGSEKAVQISRGQLKALVASSGRADFNLAGLHEFVGMTVQASVKIQESKDGYPERNVITAFKPVLGGSAPDQGQVPF